MRSLRCFRRFRNVDEVRAAVRKTLEEAGWTVETGDGREAGSVLLVNLEGPGGDQWAAIEVTEEDTRIVDAEDLLRTGWCAGMIATKLDELRHQVCDAADLRELRGEIAGLGAKLDALDGNRPRGSRRLVQRIREDIAAALSEIDDLMRRRVTPSTN
jgi:hypothetical protein